MSASDHSDDGRTDPLTALARLDATVSKWGYGVSGWAGVFAGAGALFLADTASDAVALSGVADALVGPVVWLVALYVLLGAAYAYRQRYGGPACSV